MTPERQAAYGGDKQARFEQQQKVPDFPIGDSDFWSKMDARLELLRQDLSELRQSTVAQDQFIELVGPLNDSVNELSTRFAQMELKVGEIETLRNKVDDWDHSWNN